MIMREQLRSGRTHVLAGKRGDGKTTTAVSIMQHALDGGYGLDVPAVAVTNIRFGRRQAGGDPVPACPDGVRYADTLADTLRLVGEILREYGRDVVVLWVLDEAQNYMMADQNFSKETQAMKVFLANARKFQLCSWFLSPAISNFPLRVRAFADGERSPGDGRTGYCSAQWLKDRRLAAARYGGRTDPRDVVFCREAPGAAWRPVVLPRSPWAYDLYGPDLRPGEYAYDTYAVSGFGVGANRYGRDFDLKAFLDGTSRGLSCETAAKIDAFFAWWDGAAAEGTEDPASGGPQCRPDGGRAEQDRRCRAMRSLGLTWEQIAGVEQTSANTLRSRVHRAQTSGQASGLLHVAPDGSAPATYIDNDSKRKDGAAAAPLCTERRDGLCSDV